MDQFTGNNLGHSDFVLCLELIQQSRFIHSFDYFDISRFDCAFAVMHLQNLRHGRPQTQSNDTLEKRNRGEIGQNLAILMVVALSSNSV